MAIQVQNNERITVFLCPDFGFGGGLLNDDDKENDEDGYDGDFFFKQTNNVRFM